MTFRALEITTRAGCSVNCKFCPQEVFVSRYDSDVKTLSLLDFRRVLSVVPNDILIIFSGFCEPFLNKDCVDMIRYACSQGYRVVLMTTLVGLEERDVAKLSELRFQGVCLHLPDNLGNAKIPISETYKAVLTKVLTTIKVDHFVTMNEDFISNERAGSCKGVEKRRNRGWFLCSKLVKPQFVMLPNCDVVLCCMDFGLKHSLGNLLHESYDDICRSEEFERVRRNRFSLRGDVLCRSCKASIPTYACYLRLKWEVNVFFKSC